MKNDTDLEKSKGQALSGIGLIFALWFAVPLAIWIACAGDLDASAKVGDTFGSTNALFSGLALLGVGIAIYYQHRQMVQQQAGADFSQAEMRKQTAFMRDSALISALIHLIEHQKQLFKGIDPVAGAHTYSSKELPGIIGRIKLEIQELKPRIDEWEERRGTKDVPNTQHSFTELTGLSWNNYQHHGGRIELVPVLEELKLLLEDLEEAYRRLKPCQREREMGSLIS